MVEDETSAPSPTPLRRIAQWRGLAAVRERVLTSARQEGGFVAADLTVMIAHAPREGGLTMMDGVRGGSTLREIGDKLVIAPKGCSVGGWYQPGAGGQMFTIVQLADDAPFLPEDLRARVKSAVPRLHVADERLAATVQRIASLADEQAAMGSLYAETLGTLLALDLVAATERDDRVTVARGGLAGWQAQRLRDYIEAHVERDLTLEELAALVQLSPAHFCRSFAQTFGMPPHRYHLARRVERAKALLAGNAMSLTEIALTLGFGGSSQFARTFRRLAGVTATEYRRSLR